MQASFPEIAPKKTKEWSPIDRMLANKRGSSGKRNSSTLTSELQSLPRSTPPRSATVGCQTIAWNVLVAEAVASERTRTQALQGELKALQARVKEREAAASAAEASAASHAEAARCAGNQLELAQQLLEETRAAHRKEQEAWEEERQAAEDERRRLQGEVDSAGSASKRGVEDQDHLRSELKRSKDEATSLRKKCSGLQQELTSLAREKDSLAKEKDNLLQRLEVEQAEMIERVDALQRKMSAKAK